MAKRDVFVTLNVDLKGAEGLAPLVQRQRELKQSNAELKKAYKELNVQLAEGAITQEKYETSLLATDTAIARNRVELRALSGIVREAENDFSGLTGAGLRFRDKMAEANVETIRASGLLNRLEEAARQTQSDIERLGNDFKSGAISQEQYAKESAQLSTRLESLQGDIAAVNSRMTASAQDTATLKKQSEQLTQELRDLATQYAKGTITAEQFAKGSQQVGKELQQTNAKVDQLSAGMRGNIEGGIKNALSNFTGYVAGAFALQSLVSWGNELRERGIEIEQITARAKVLFGEGFEPLNAAAEANGEAIGKSRVEYLQLASVAADVFSNLKFGADETQKLSQELVQAAGDIEDFTAGSVSAEQALGILKNAALGNTKGLKELNIPVKANAKDIALLADEIQASEGVTRAQAESLANLRFTFEALNPKITAFKNEAGGADEAADRATAQFKNQTDALAQQLAPAFTTVTTAIGNYIGGIASAVKEQDGLFTKISAFLGTIQGGGLNAVAQQQGAVANAATTVADAAKKLKAAQDAYAESIPGLQKRIAELTEIQKANAEQGFTGAVASNEAQLKSLRALLETKVQEAIVSRQSAQAKVDEGQSIEQLNAKLNALKEERTSIVETDKEGLRTNAAAIAATQARIDAIEGEGKSTAGLGKAVSSTSKAVKEFVDGSLGKLNEQIGVLKDQQKDATSSEQFDTYQRQIDVLEESIGRITGEIQDLPSLSDVLFTAEENNGPTEPPPLPVADPETVAQAVESNKNAMISQAELEEELAAASINRQGAITEATEQFGEVLGGVLTGQIENAEDFGKAFIRIMFQLAKKFINIQLAQAAAQSMAQPDSVATFGATGIARAGILAALINGVLSALEGALGGFESGGYTGHGASNEPAGIVHRGEYVMSKPAVQRIGVDKLEQLHRSATGYTTPKVRSLSDVHALLTPKQSMSVGMFGYQTGGAVVDALTLPRPSADQVLAAQNTAALRGINFRPQVDVNTIRSASSSVDVATSRASLV